MAISRRKFLGVSATAAASVMLPWRFGAKDALAVANSPQLTKWIQPIRGLSLLDPNGIPVAAGVPDPVFAKTTMYEITAGEFTDQLHPSLGPTTLWGYWDTTNPLKRHLGGLIIATRGTAVRMRVKNTLPTPHLFPNDTTIPGANLGDNRAAVHLHGGYVPWISDGGPFNWYDPAGGAGLSFQNGPGSVLDNIPAKPMTAGEADYFYPNDQSTRLMWYHDHAWGITRLNAYAGVATGYAIFDPAQEASLGSMVPTNNLTNLGSLIPLVFQDKVFVDQTTIGVTDPTWATFAPLKSQPTGSLWYEHVYNPKEFKLKTGGAFLPVPNPSAIPEFFGDTMLCNGTVYPLVTVEAKRYRFLALNACNARFLNINLLEVAPGAEITTDPKTLMPVAGTLPGPSMVQIGTEGGYLVAPVTHPNGLFFNPATMTGNMLLGCAERSDFIIDFTGLAGKEYIMYNDAPGPFPAGPPTTDYFLGNPKNPIQPAVGTGPDTRQILRFKVVAAAAPDPQPPFAFPANMPREPFLVPYTNTVPPIAPLPLPAVPFVTRNLTLNEDFDPYGRLRQLVGTTAPVAGRGGAAVYGREYIAPATETPAAGGVEVWNIWNLTADTHPMHFHLVDVQILKRQPFKIVNGVFTPTGAARGPEPDELGWKETCKMHPGEVITVCMKFDMPPVPFTVPASQRTGGNEYVWHCHILEHEEHDMMRPLVVSGQNPVLPIVVTPASVDVSSATGGTAVYTVTNATNLTITAPAGAPAAVITATGFEVAVAAGAAIGPITYTVGDKTGRAAVNVTLNIIA